MKLSKGVSAGAVFGLVAILILAPVSVGDDYPFCGDKLPVDLIVAKNYIGGSVIISNDAETIRVEFVADDPWTLVETHVHVADCWKKIPQTKKGNAIPGQFAYSEEHDHISSYLYEIPLSTIGSVECGDSVYVAAHAVVAKEIPCEQATISCVPAPVCWETQTGWGDGDDFPGHDWSMYVKYELQCCGKQLTMPQLSVQYTVSNAWGTYSYFDSYVEYQSGDTPLPYTLGGSADPPYYLGWCVNNHNAAPYITPGTTYTATLYDTQNPPTSSPDLDFGYWDNINWILNNKGTYTKQEIQNAIWGFTDSSYTPSGNAGTLYTAALGYDGYLVPSGGVIGVIVYITPSIQLTMIEVDP